MKNHIQGFLVGAVFGGALTLAIAPWRSASATAPISPEPGVEALSPALDSPLQAEVDVEDADLEDIDPEDTDVEDDATIETQLGSKQPSPMGADSEKGTFVELGSEGRFEPSCGEAYAEVIDPDSSKPRFVVYALCNGTQFTVAAVVQKLPAKIAPEHVRLMDVKTGQERIGSSASMDVTKFGDVGQIVAGSIEFDAPGGLNKPTKHISGTFRVVRKANRFSP